MPYRIDLFAIFIFLGVVQAFFLCSFFFSRDNRQRPANLMYGVLLLAMGLCMVETLLMYTGYIAHCLFLVDFSEPLSFVLGPAFYLMVLAITRGELPKRWYLHFAFAAIYFILVIPFFLSSDDVKFNSWVESYRLNIPVRPFDYRDSDPRLFWVTDHHTKLTLASIIIYALLSLSEVIRTFRAKKESFIQPANKRLRDLRNGTLQIGFITVLVLIIKYFNPNDTGDHIFTAYIGVTVYVTSFRVMRDSGFFRRATIDEPQKYKSSALSEDQRKHVLERLLAVMEKEKPFLRPDFSLPDLAQQVGTSVHILSQVINAGLQKSFFEMTAEYRVEEAKRLLRQQSNIKVEEIAERVGYNSKSSFNTAFKKITGTTPSDFRSRAG
ncbi:MAG TPA: helix-turn-helix domain-containing protein [Chryseosolibacter sp.]|nr:helix-turn-helix domain-containing protein [Chryseosolibacter sp.]